jgi:CheY-like chemotaxis protein
VATDAQEAVDFLRRRGRYGGAPRPDIVLLDPNVASKSGHQVLAEIKTDQDLRVIPTLVFTRSQDPADIAESYFLHANAHITKPDTPDALADIVIRIDEFFSQVASLPMRTDATAI